MAVLALVVIILRDPARALLRRAQVGRWPDASQALTGEYPERIAERVATFLAGLPGDSAAKP